MQGERLSPFCGRTEYPLRSSGFDRKQPSSTGWANRGIILHYTWTATHQASSP